MVASARGRGREGDRGRTAVGDKVRAAHGPFRLIVAVVLVACAPLVESTTVDEQVRFGLLVAFVWVPVAGFVGMVARRRPSQIVDVVDLAVDLGLLVLVEAVLAPTPVLILAALLLLIAYVTYAGGPGLVVAAFAAGLVLMTVAAAGRASGSDWSAVIVYAVVAGTIVWLLDVVAVERWNASDRLLLTREKSDAILTGVAEAVVVTSPTGRIRQWNRAATRTFSLTADDALSHECAAALQLRCGVRELDCAKGCALLSIEDGVDVEVWRQLPTGQRQPLLACALPVLDAWGHVAEVVHSYRDITRVKQAEEAKTLFLATASHELKTPLTVISGFSQMLLASGGDLDDEENRAALQAIVRRAGQLSAIVDRLLMSGRIEAGRIELAPEPLDVVPLLEEQAAALGSSTGREIVVAPAGAVPDAWADRDALITIVDHLLDNAVKYSPAGGPITLAAAADEDTVTVMVTDQGVGMTPDQVEGCFERFWQAEPSDVRRFGGTGIGLYIVRSLVEALGGEVSVTSAPGEGSSFRVRIPRADRRSAEPAPDEGELDPGRGDPSIIREYMRQLGVRVEAS